MSLLGLVPIYAGARADLLDPLAEHLERVFRTTVALHSPSFDPEAAFDAGRGQYNSTLLLAGLLREPTGCKRVLGVATVDLFIPVLTYVFGEAQLDGRVAVVSTRRLAPEVYGLPADPRLLTARLIKEAVHELGHTYGLMHCHRRACVMMRSTYVEEIDLKSDGFCERCWDAIRLGLAERC